ERIRLHARGAMDRRRPAGAPWRLARRDRPGSRPRFGNERDRARPARAEVAVIAPLPRPPAIASAGEYEQWLAENPAPDLQAFVRQHGDWRRLPPHVWASFTPQEQEGIKANGSYRAETPAEGAMRGQRIAGSQGRLAGEAAATLGKRAMIDLRAAARALCGDVIGRDAVAVPGPGHSARDRSLTVKFDPRAPDGFLVYSHCDDDWRDCRDHVRAR